MKYQFMKEYRGEFPVKKMSKALNVSTSGFYTWLKRPISLQEFKNERLKSRIKELFYDKHRQMAGSPLITEDLHDEIEFASVSRTRVAKIMHTEGLCCKIQKKFVATTDSNHSEPIADNILNRDFSPATPNKAIVGDITYIRVASHWVYLSVFIDLFSRKVVGWDLSGSLAASSTCLALKKYFAKGTFIEKVLIHSDRGIQYACSDFKQLLKSVNAVQSMSRRGNCWDNAVSESFFHTLKTRLTHHRTYDTIEELQRDLFWYIEIYYNRVRKHSFNDWMTPEKKENIFYQTQTQIAA
jgi:putative transposase